MPRPTRKDATARGGGPSSSARSLASSRATTRAATPGGTWTAAQPRTTCALVRTWPSSLTKNPEPVETMAPRPAGRGLSPGRRPPMPGGGDGEAAAAAGRHSRANRWAPRSAPRTCARRRRAIHELVHDWVKTPMACCKICYYWGRDGAARFRSGDEHGSPSGAFPQEPDRSRTSGATTIEQGGS